MKRISLLANLCLALGLAAPRILFAESGLVFDQTQGMLTGQLNVSSNIVAAGSVTASSATFTNTAGAGLIVNSSAYLAVAGGNVGIGTTNPSDGRVVAVQSNSGAFVARSATDAVADGIADVTSFRSVDLDGSHWANARYDAYSHAWGYGASATTVTAMFVNGSGNVGIGTTAPLAKLDVFAGSTARIMVSATGADHPTLTFADSNGNAQYGTIKAYDLTLNNGSVDLVKVTSAGNVGIGTAEPGAKLDVAFGTKSQGLSITGGGSSTGDSATVRGINVEFHSNNDTVGLDGIRSSIWHNLNQGGSAITGIFNNIVGGGGTYAQGIGISGTAYQPDMNGSGLAIGVKGVANGSGSGGGAEANGKTYAGYFDNTTAVAGLNYGIYVNTTAQGTYGIYQNGGAKNYFSGNVGIGTAGPGYKLDVSGQVNVAGANAIVNTVSHNAILRVTDAVAADIGPQLGFWTKFNAAGNYQGIAAIAGRRENATDGNLQGYLQFVTSDNGGTLSEKVRITSAGNVGIGTTSPVGKLSIANGTGYPSTYLTYSTSAAQSTLTLTKNTGNSGYPSDYTASLNFASDISPNGSYAPANKWGIRQYEAYNGSRWFTRLDFFDYNYNNTAVLSVLDTGNVGIGTTNPGANLQIGDVGATNTRFTGNPATAQFYWQTTERVGIAIDSNNAWSLGAATGGAGGIRLGSGPNFSYLVGAGTSLLLNPTAGNVGIGTTAPAAKLDVNGSINTSGDMYFTQATPTLYSAAKLYIRSGAGESLFLGSNNVNQKWTLDASYNVTQAGNLIVQGTGNSSIAGNLGIGTASPAAKLDVQGTIRQATLTTYVRTISAPGASPVTFTILRQFHDSVNWSVGGILIEEFTYSYDASRFDYGMYFARYGYSGNAADVLTKISGSQLPFWGAATQTSGNYYYRDLSITVPAYYNITVRITSPIGITTDLNGAQANVVYLY